MRNTPVELADGIENPQDIVLLLQETALFLWKDWPKNMDAVGLDSAGNFSLRGVCPHCNHDSVFMRVTTNYSGFLRHRADGIECMLIAVMHCQGCLLFILGMARHVEGTYGYEYSGHYPLGMPDDSVAEEIPEHIQPDFREALRCLSVNAYNATGEMCRRAIEASCLDLGAPKKEVLEDMIDWLEAERVITPGLRDVAHNVRLGGNRCAHPTPAHPTPAIQGIVQTQQATPIAAPIERIEKEHAEAIVEFTRHFFQYVYVTPKQLHKYDFSKPKTNALKP
jgi:Domain of unknown function (DUF4145)